PARRHAGHKIIASRNHFRDEKMYSRRWHRRGATMSAAITIREFRESDWPSIWPILESIIRRGDSYAFSPDTPEAEMHRIWIESPSAAYVAEFDAEIVGTYFIKPNQPCLGDHICNCGYAVSELARGQGVASAMCEHSQQVAIARGFRAMQYNF